MKLKITASGVVFTPPPRDGYLIHESSAVVRDKTSLQLDAPNPQALLDQVDAFMREVVGQGVYTTTAYAEALLKIEERDKSLANLSERLESSGREASQAKGLVDGLRKQVTDMEDEEIEQAKLSLSDQMDLARVARLLANAIKEKKPASRHVLASLRRHEKRLRGLGADL